jgi:cytochrome oxidase Cu insertion factor (SCO1/SenC/PrrC family)
MIRSTTGRRTGRLLVAAGVLTGALAGVACGTTGDDAGGRHDPTAAAAPVAAQAPGGDEMLFKKKDDGLLAVGSAAPDFAVPDQDGNIRTLSEFKGKRVLLWFYPKADTPG